MMYVNVVLNRLVNMRLYETSRTVEVAEFIGLAALAVLVPLLLSSNQLLAGSAVNFMLIMAAINVRGWKKIIPLIALPSISAAAFGFLFGGLTSFLFYLVPFICIGNLLILFIFKLLYVSKRNNYFTVLATAAVLKSGFLFIAALILVEFSVIPPAFLIAMGVMQLSTAMMGGVLAFPVNAAYRRYFTG